MKLIHLEFYRSSAKNACPKVTQITYINLENFLIFSSEKEEQSNYIPRDVYDIWRKEEWKRFNTTNVWTI